MTGCDCDTQDTLGYSTKAPLKLNEAANRICWLVYIKQRNKQTQQDPGSHMMWLGILSLSISGLCYFPTASSGSWSNYSITLSPSRSASMNISGPAGVMSPFLNQSLFFFSHIWVVRLTLELTTGTESWEGWFFKEKTWDLLEKRWEGFWVGKIRSCITMTSYNIIIVDVFKNDSVLK